MRKEMLGAVAAFVLTTGTAFAQDAPATAADPMQPPPPSATQSEAGPATGTGAATSNREAAATGARTSDEMRITSADQMMGKTVVGPDGRKLGTVADVIIDPSSGEAQEVILSHGGLLGLGEKQVAIEFSKLRPTPDDDELQTSSLTAEQIEQMPEFEYEDGTVSVNRPGNVGETGE